MSTSKNKPKLDKDDWKECLSCGSLISNRDVVPHVNCCPNYIIPNIECDRLLGFSPSPSKAIPHGFADSPITNDSKPTISQNLFLSDEQLASELETSSSESSFCSPHSSHGFCLQNKLYGQCSSISNKFEELKNVPPSLQHCVALLHPSTMRVCGIGIGDHVLINGSCHNPQQRLSFAWPSASGHPTSVRLQYPPWKSGDKIKVQLYPLSVVPAKLVVFEIQEDLRQFKDKLANVILVQLCNHMVMVGSECSVNFFGRQIQVSVRFVSGPRNRKSEQSEANVDKALQKSFEAMCSLNDSTSEMDNVCSPKTVPLSPSKGFKKATLTPRKQVLENALKDDFPQFFMLSHTSKVKFKESPTISKQSRRKLVTFDSVGGLDEEIACVKDTLDLVFNSASDISNYGVALPKGLILFGPSGTGKTLLCQVIKEEGNYQFISISGPDIFSKYYGETESKLKQLFDEAKESGPSIVFLDDIDLLCPRREKSTDQEKRFLNAFIQLVDGIQPEDDGIFILGTTNHLEDLDLALRRPGRLDKLQEIPVPSPFARTQILTKLLINVNHRLELEDIKRIAENAHSFTGGDLALMLRDAVQTQLKKSLNGKCEELTAAQLEISSKSVRPSAMKEVTLEVPKVRWSDIGGQEDVKLKLLQSVQWPLKNPEVFQRLGIKPPHGLLMYGPPGCSKTLIAKALATESGLNFFAIKGPELFNKWVGESERAVREVFRKARAAAPSIVFFDELDALAAERTGSQGASGVGNRVLAQLLNEMDGVEALQGVTVVAATNRPDMIDKALLRPGRLDRIVYVPLPDGKTRKEILYIRTRKMPLASDVDLDHLVNQTEGYSGAEVVGVCQEAGLVALSESLNTESIQGKHFQQALRMIRPRTDPKSIAFYEEYQNQSTCLNS